MAWQVVRRVFDHSRHDGVLLLALVALAEWSDRDGCIKNRTIADLADRLKCSERTAKRHVKILRASGELYAPESAGGRGRAAFKIVTAGLSSEAARELINSVNIDTVSEINSVNIDTLNSVNIGTVSEINSVNIDTLPICNGIKETELDGKITRARAPAVLTKLDPARPFDARLLALAAVCQLDANMPAHRHKLESAAANLAKYDAAMIKARYSQPNGAGGWNWYRHDWRGQKEQPPTPANVIETITRQAPAAPQQESAADKLARSRGQR